MNNKAFYALVQGRFYRGDVEGKKYHWRKGIPGSKQLLQDLKKGKGVSFVYYRTWDKEIKKGKYFYGAGIFDNRSLKEVKAEKNKTEYFASIKEYKPFPVPLVVEESLRKKVWPGSNRQAGIKKISESLFSQIINPGQNPISLNGLASMVGEQNLENLLNGQITPTDLSDSESANTSKRTIKTEVYKRTKKVINSLKKRYKGICQISGKRLVSYTDIGIDVTEAHHLKYLCKNGAEADPSNIIIISPEWHRVIHKRNPLFDRKHNKFIFEKEKTLVVKLPGHLER